MIKIKNKIINFCVLFLAISCIEPFDIKTINFESALVIEAVITDEYTYQTISINRTFPIDSNELINEKSADVKVIDDQQNIFQFKEQKPGEYVSINKFKALPNVNYQLQITTLNGKSYTSENVQLTNRTEINDIKIKKDVDDNNYEKGIHILINSLNSSNNTQYYRYEYEETYKVIAPNWSPRELIVKSNTIPYEVELVYKDPNVNDRVCYASNFSKGIIQVQTDNLTEDNVSDFDLVYIERNDVKLWYTYSILVKQYTQSREAYNFYKLLDELSISNDLFSQKQPGFVSGNISSESINEKVIGIFEISSLAQKRIFLNRYDLFRSGKPSVACYDIMYAPELENGKLTAMLNSGDFKFYLEKDPTLDIDQPIIGDGDYYLIESKCADCRLSGSNIKPDFWVD